MLPEGVRASGQPAGVPPKRIHAGISSGRLRDGAGLSTPSASENTPPDRRFRHPFRTLGPAVSEISLHSRQGQGHDMPERAREIALPGRGGLGTVGFRRLGDARSA